MPPADFIHLRTHSAYSLSTGAIKTEKLVELCRRHRMPAVAVTDTGNLFGALEIATACAEAGIQPIIGCELAIRRPESAESGLRAGKIGLAPSPDTLVLLVQDEAGYGNLLKLVSKAFLDTESGETPQIDLALLEAHGEGLIALTGGPSGAVGRLLGEGQDEAAQAMLARLGQIFPGRLYIELMRHGMVSEDRIETALIEFAYRGGLPLVATNDAHFAERDLYDAHDALLCISEGTVLSNPNRKRLTPEHYFKSAAEMRVLFADLPEAVDNTVAIARRCAFMPEPRRPILPPYQSESGRTEADELRAMAAFGLERRLETQLFRADMTAEKRGEAAKPYLDRLEFELGIIVKMGFAGYFLIVAEFIQWAKAHGIPVGPGRGSGAGSVVAWSLTITDLDPIRFGLLFERFLNPERISMPDFDIDFCQDRRDEVIRHVQEKYGRDRVAQIITFGKLQSRAVLRDVGRVLEMPYGQVDRICKLVPNNPANPVPLKQAIENEPALVEMRDSDESVARLMAIALKLEGLYRHASTHAAGVVIGDRPLDRLVPLYRDPRSDMPVTQFNMKYVESAGLVKFDFLGLKTLTVMSRAVELLARRGIALDLSTIPLDDAASFEMLTRADTVGVFQVEGQGMRDVLKKLRPNCFEDIIALVALYRPGPMDDIPKYLRAKHGEEKPDYLHPSLEPILRESYGVMVYQEQVMQIAQVLSGYSLGSADLLRRAMGKKIKSEMEAQRKNFLDGAAARGVSAAQAETIFEKVEKFAGYGFNKCHSAPYAMVAYQTAYLKANHPVEFLAASMTLDLGNTDKLNVFRQECGRLGIKLLPPDINRSAVEFGVEETPEGPAIRYALAAVKGVGALAMRAVVEERDTGGPFKDLTDFSCRIDARSFNKRQFESLAKAGAFDPLNANRAQTLAAAELLLRHANASAQERDSQQVNLFGGAATAAPRIVLPHQTDWVPMERLQYELEALGFYLSSHPLDAYGKSLARIGVVRSSDLLAQLAMGGVTRFKLAGIMVSKKERSSARGNRFAFLQMSDASGFFEVTVFSEVLSQARALLEPGQKILVTADARVEEESVRLTAQRIEALDGVVAQAAAGLKIFLDRPEALQKLRDTIACESGGKGRITVVVPLSPARQVEIALPGGFRIGPRVHATIKSLAGILDAQEI